jgi:hypothetical protein
MACGRHISIIAAYILHVNDPLVNFAGLILFFAKVCGTSHSRQGQQWRNVLHVDASNEKVCLESGSTEQE